MSYSSFDIKRHFTSYDMYDNKNMTKVNLDDLGVKRTVCISEIQPIDRISTKKLFLYKYIEKSIHLISFIKSKILC